jgi:hypothetical protein
MVLAELAKVAIVALRSNPELIGDLRRHIQPEIGEGGATLAGIHGQPVVVVGVDESLREEAMDLNRAVQKFELLCLQDDLAGMETQIHKDQAKNSLVHTAPWWLIGKLERELSTTLPRKRGPKSFYPPKKTVCSCTGFRFCTKLLISEFSIILSPESGILRKAPQHGGFEISIEGQQMQQELERPIPEEMGWATTRCYNR